MSTEPISGTWIQNADTVWAGKNPIVCYPPNSRVALDNARLVSAAPDMLSALKKAKDWMDDDMDDNDMSEHDRNVYESIMEAINAALKKAAQP